MWQKSGAKAFSRLVQKSVPGPAVSVLAAELSGDDKLDLVVALAGQKNVAVLAGQAGGMLGNATTVAAGVEPRWLAAVDVNCDGLTDVLASSTSESKLGLVFNRGSGTLAPAQQIDLSANLTGPAQALLVAV